MNKLAVEGISKDYGSLSVLKDISFSLDAGQFVSVLGPSGCGKTTLFHIISGLLLPDAGQVLVDGQDDTGKTGKISFMQQKDLLLPWRTILDNTALPMMLKGIPTAKARTRAAEYFPRFGLEGFEQAYPRQLSGGMRQRAALLRTYLFKSDVMLLDEPFGALDAITRRHMQDWLQEIVHSLHLTVLLITHDVEEAVRLSQRVVLLSPRPASVKKVLEIAIPREPGTVLPEAALSSYKAHLLDLLWEEP